MHFSLLVVLICMPKKCNMHLKQIFFVLKWFIFLITLVVFS